MSNKVKEKLRKQISALFRARDYSQVVKFFISCRKIIEIDGLKTRFTALSFYSDWLAHSQIDRQSYDFLEKINVGFHEIHLPETNRYLKNQDYIDVVIDALQLDNLINNVVDFVHIYFDCMPIIEGDIIVNGKVLPLEESYEKTKFLISNGNLDVGLPFVALNGIEDRRDFLIKIFQELEGVKIKFPSRHQDQQKTKIVNLISDLCYQINLHKESDPRLDPNFDNTKYYIINSFVIDRVEETRIHVEMEIEGKDAKIISYINL